ncbi:MAG: hypothetical protein ACRENE_20380, partial [Polyangiaceae bacterium]
GGCCDSAGRCQKGTLTAQCGTKGVSCVDCSVTTACIVGYTPCCSSAGACSCAAAGIVCP